MEQVSSNNVSRAPVESRPPPGGSNGLESFAPNQSPVRPPLNRSDSRSTFSPQAPRPVTPQLQPRPQFQPGGAVTNPPQIGPRLGTPPPRGPLNTVPLGVPSTPRNQAPQPRPSGPQSIAPQQGPRPQQSPISVQPPQRAPAPNSLQFGPRQPPQFSGSTTPDGSRPQIGPQSNGKLPPNLSTPPSSGQLSRQPSQGSLKGPDTNKPANLENQNLSNDQNNTKAENVNDIPGVPKARSYSIAGAPGVASPLKMEDDRRKSVSAIGGKIDDFGSRSPGLGLIQEGRDSKDNIRGSKESVKSEASNDGGKDNSERPESRLLGSKMTESFMGSLSNLTSKKKVDDDDDVILHNNLTPSKTDTLQTQNKPDLSDRSPSLTRSDDSPEPKNLSQSSVVTNKSQSVTPEPQRAKTPKIEVYPDQKPESVKDTVTLGAKLNKNIPKSPTGPKSPSAVKKPTDFNASLISSDSKKSTPRKVASAPKARQKDGDNDSGVDESTQGNDLNGSPGSPNKKMPSKLPTKEKSNSSLKPSLSRSSSKSATAKTPENPLPTEKKKLPMNKIQVGNAPSPNIKAVKSKIGSLENSTYKPGGGKVKIENRKIDFNNVTPRIAAKNETYTPSGGSKKITTTKLEWNAKSKIGSLQNTTYKPGGGDKKIETVKVDFKDKAKPKVASTANINHKPGGGSVKIENQKLDFKAQSKVGSLDNVKHKPGGGEIKIFNDKEYIKQIGEQSPLPNSHNQSRQESPIPPTAKPPKSDENLNQQPC